MCLCLFCISYLFKFQWWRIQAHSAFPDKVLLIDVKRILQTALERFDGSSPTRVAIEMVARLGADIFLPCT